VRSSGSVMGHGPGRGLRLEEKAITTDRPALARELGEDFLALGAWHDRDRFATPHEMNDSGFGAKRDGIHFTPRTTVVDSIRWTRCHNGSSLDLFVMLATRPADIFLDSNGTIIPNLDGPEVLLVGDADILETVFVEPGPDIGNVIGATGSGGEAAHLDAFDEPFLDSIQHGGDRIPNMFHAFEVVVGCQGSVEIHTDMLSHLVNPS